MKGSLIGVALLLALAKADEYHQYHPSVKSHRHRRSLKEIADTEDADYWARLGKSEIEKTLDNTRSNMYTAKNIILCIGDGMSIPTISAARIYKGQQLKGIREAEKEYLTFERLDHLGHSKTYDIDKQTPDSASTATAMFTGVKTKYYTMGYDSSIDHEDVNSMLSGKKVEGLLHWAQAAGKNTGIVTTARLTHATPAALYAHTFDRDWECDSKFNGGDGSQPEGTHDIAYQFVNSEAGKKVKVALGGGYPAFYRNDSRPEIPGGNKDIDYKDFAGYCFRNDENNLADQWQEAHENSVVALTRSQLMNVDIENTDYLLGLLAESHVAYHDERGAEDPSITEMVDVAMKMLLKNNDNGFFMMLESGRIDHAHHAVHATRALSETVQFDNAIEHLIQILEDNYMLDETLIVVTADHAHTMSFSGYPDRGMDIHGLSGMTHGDGLPYTTLSYANGEGYDLHNIVVDGKPSRLDLNTLTMEEIEAFEFTQTSPAPRSSETHGGDDVAIFASGPWSHLFHTTHEQTHIAHVLAFSACIGPYASDPRCADRDPLPSPTFPPQPDSAVATGQINFVIFTSLVLFINLIPAITFSY